MDQITLAAFVGFCMGVSVCLIWRLLCSRRPKDDGIRDWEEVPMPNVPNMDNDKWREWQLRAQKEHMSAMNKYLRGSLHSVPTATTSTEKPVTNRNRGDGDA